MSFDIGSLQRKALARYPFFGSVATGMEYEETDRVRTTAGDGRTIYYNPDWLSSLSLEAQVFALSHELCHAAFQHIRRSRGKDPILWKKATDAVVNQLLKRDGLELPPYALDDPEAIDYDAEGYYELLLEEKLAMDLIEGNMQKPRGQGSGDSQGEGSGNRQQEDEDDHSMWEEAAEQEMQDLEEKEEELLKELQKIQEILEDSGERPQDDPEGDQEEDEDQEKALVSQKVSQAGNDVSPDIRPIEEIGQAAPVLDWRMILRETAPRNVDWSLEHAILEDGIVRPILEEQPMPETEIVLDASWSVDDDLLRSFLRECKNILQLSRIWVGCFDTVFYGFHEIRTEQDIEEMVFEGGGGTDFNAAVNAFSLRVDNRIIFTDGEADMPEKPLDAVWLVYGEKDIEPDGGRVIRITPDQLERLRDRV